MRRTNEVPTCRRESFLIISLPSVSTCNLAPPQPLLGLYGSGEWTAITAALYNE